MISKGGYHGHLIVIGGRRALCGYFPQDHPNSSMRRAGWAYQEHENSRSPCRKCFARAQQIAAGRKAAA